MKHPDPRLRAYRDLVVAEPTSVTAVRDPDAAWQVLVEDALEAAALIRELGPAEAVDVGSGGGSPGIPIAIALGLPVTLLEATGTKCRFLERAVAALEVPCTVVHARSEEYARGEGRDRFPLALARALAPPPVAVELVLPLVAVGGAAILWTGAGVDADAVARTAGVVGGSVEASHSVDAKPPPRRPSQARRHSGAVSAPSRDRPCASARPGTIVPSMSSRVYALANQKGGVGKTTTAINMAACVAEAGTRVLLIDLDPQANATTGLGFRPDELDASTYDLLHGRPLDSVIIETAVPNLFLAPSHPDLAAAQVEIPGGADHGTLLRDLLAGTEERFPYVFVDCPPSLGLLTVNALAAANRLIVPVQCEYYALEGLAQLLQSVELVRTRINPRLGVTGVLLTMFDGRTRLAADVASEVRSYFGPLVFETVVPRSVRLAEAPSHGLPICRYDSASPGADAYYRVAMEVVERG